MAVSRAALKGALPSRRTPPPGAGGWLPVSLRPTLRGLHPYDPLIKGGPSEGEATGLLGRQQLVLTRARPLRLLPWEGGEHTPRSFRHGCAVPMTGTHGASSHRRQHTSETCRLHAHVPDQRSALSSRERAQRARQRRQLDHPEDGACLLQGSGSWCLLPGPWSLQCCPWLDRLCPELVLWEPDPCLPHLPAWCGLQSCWLTMRRPSPRQALHTMDFSWWNLVSRDLFCSTRASTEKPFPDCRYFS